MHRTLLAYALGLGLSAVTWAVPIDPSTLVDHQDLREIWEIRYWRHLLEHFIIWEDRE